ncbi:hypothetical protein [Paralysiella testudinis]|uniref:Uncharacterized protein n=1 Tax=Paralysiella testudinis TaxID=2809020 RepID=A0A892ZFJ8_9NEIS|nr:hypothetical protein [Paralysiella testudinis]QRQ81722.1 hypothetical protein JQU52_13745 [Paralysiella testudinis]
MPEKRAFERGMRGIFTETDGKWITEAGCLSELGFCKGLRLPENMFSGSLCKQ